jgi:hypothetical protein
VPDGREEAPAGEEKEEASAAEAAVGEEEAAAEGEEEEEATGVADMGAVSFKNGEEEGAAGEVEAVSAARRTSHLPCPSIMLPPLPPLPPSPCPSLPLGPLKKRLGAGEASGLILAPPPPPPVGGAGSPAGAGCLGTGFSIPGTPTQLKERFRVFKININHITLLYNFIPRLIGLLYWR